MSKVRNLQLTTAYHVSHNENKPMVTEGKENTSLIKNPPHLGSDFAHHVLPTSFTGVELFTLL
jgi:hypothetical protein